MWRASSFALLLIYVAAAVSAFDPVMENSKMQFIFRVWPDAVGGTLYPKDSTGKVLTQYWVLVRFTNWYENGTDRSLVPNPADILLTNPAPNDTAVIWNFTAAYTLGNGEFLFQVTEHGINATIFNHTLIGQGGAKASIVVQNDSNVFNTTTEKTFDVILITSHPILNFTQSFSPTPYQHDFLITTEFYTVRFNEPTLSASDGVETLSTITPVNQTNDTVVLLSTVYWNRTFSFDPETSILLLPSATGAGDGGGGPELAYLALIALILAPLLVLLVIGVSTAVLWMYRRRSHVTTQREGVNF